MVERDSLEKVEEKEQGNSGEDFKVDGKEEKDLVRGTKASVSIVAKKATRKTSVGPQRKGRERG